jgi:SNF2 family DNA or RNA helicase
LSKGFTCTRSDTVVLFEPQLSSHHELQAYGRVSRIGQRHLATFGYRLLDQTQIEEKDILSRQATRMQLQARATRDAQGSDKEIGENETGMGRSEDYPIRIDDAET